MSGEAPESREVRPLGEPSTAVQPAPSRTTAAAAERLPGVPISSTDSVWARIKRHKVVEWTLAYLAFAYAVLHGVQMLRETFDWPFLVPRLTVFALVLGAPIAVTLAWYHGHRARHRVSGQELSILIALLLVAGSVLLWVSRHSHEGATAAASTTASPASVAATFSPPPHSIAVLPFVNMSGDKEQEYFSDGLTEELLNSLSSIDELQVAARTSSFSFQGEHPDLATVAHKLNVASVLEGSVRRSGHTIRITAQLSNAVTGFHIWSQTYDRDLSDVLRLQTEIATAVARALKVKLLGDFAAKIELGGTRNPAAFDAYLRGSKAFSSSHDVSSLQSAVSEYTEALRLDPTYALAFAGRSRALSAYAAEIAIAPAMREFFDKAQADARKALELAPDLAEGHLALAFYFTRGSLDFAHADEAYERAVVLAPGNAEVLADSGRFAVIMGRLDAGLAAGRRAVVLDPLGPRSRYVLGQALYLARRDKEAVAAFGEVISLEPDYKEAYGLRGLAYYRLGEFQRARSSCETKPDYWASQWCLAVTNDKLGQHADAEAMLKKFQAAYGNAGPVEYASIYAQWGNKAKALEWLTAAMRLRNPDLVYVKTDPLLDPLRKEPRFQAIARALKFPAQ